MQRPRDQRDRRKQRLVILVGVVILLVIGGIAVFGYYREFMAPARVLAARVGDTRYTQGDLVKRMRMFQATLGAAGQPIDFATAPFETLNSMLEAGMTSRFAPGFGIRVTEGDVDLYLEQQFSPSVPEGQEVREGQIQREYRGRYQTFLDKGQLSDKDYRRLVEERVYKARIREVLGEQIPLITDQVEVHWIVLPSPVGLIGSAAPSSPPDQILKRLEEEDFEDVAKELSAERRYADDQGYVGWVPQGAFHFLDETLFGGENRKPLSLNEISQPMFSQDGTYLVKVTAGPEEREISETMREKLKDQAFENWILEKKEIGTREGWWEMKFDSKIYSWVVKQVTEAAPRVTPQAGGQR